MPNLTAKGSLLIRAAIIYPTNRLKLTFKQSPLSYGPLAQYQLHRGTFRLVIVYLIDRKRSHELRTK